MHDLPKLRSFQVWLAAVAALAAFTSFIPASTARADIPLGYIATSNDSLGEARDRWRTSAVQGGLFFGERDDLTELRFRSDIFAPANVADPATGDRLHAGVLAVGLHRYGIVGAWDWRAGGEIVVIGPQTGMLALQTELHEALGFAIPALDDYQIGNRVTALVSGEIGQARTVGPVSVRPFAEIQIGPEDTGRIGADLAFGTRTHADTRFVRMAATGQILPIGDGPRGTSFFAGGDIAYVEDSLYLPSSRGFTPDSARVRLRAGVHHDFGNLDVTFGTAWLSPEFEGQPEGQFVGTLSAAYRF